MAQITFTSTFSLILHHFTKKWSEMRLLVYFTNIVEGKTNFWHHENLRQEEELEWMRGKGQKFALPEKLRSSLPFLIIWWGFFSFLFWLSHYYRTLTCLNATSFTLLWWQLSNSYFVIVFFASSLLLHALALFVEVEENNVALASSQKTSVVKLLDFFQLFMALKVNVTVSLLILQRLILRLLKTETTGCQSKFCT